MIRVYQNVSLGALHREINTLGWDAAAQKYPAVKAYLDTSTFGSERWNPDFFAHYKRVAEIDTDDLEEAFGIGNIGPEERITGLLDHSISVGDLLRIDNDYYMVDSIGFTKVYV